MYLCMYVGNSRKNARASLQACMYVCVYVGMYSQRNISARCKKTKLCLYVCMYVCMYSSLASASAACLLFQQQYQSLQQQVQPERRRSLLGSLCHRSQPGRSPCPLKGLHWHAWQNTANAIEAARTNIRLATTKCHASQTSWKVSM